MAAYNEECEIHNPLQRNTKVSTYRGCTNVSAELSHYHPLQFDWSRLVVFLQPPLQILRNFASDLRGPSFAKVVLQILLPTKYPATNCTTSDISSLLVQSSDNGRDVSAFVPQCNDPLSVITRQLRGHCSGRFQQTLQLICAECDFLDILRRY